MWNLVGVLLHRFLPTGGTGESLNEQLLNELRHGLTAMLALVIESADERTRDGRLIVPRVRHENMGLRFHVPAKRRGS